MLCPQNQTHLYINYFVQQPTPRQKMYIKLHGLEDRISQRKFTQSIMKKSLLRVSEIPSIFCWYSVTSGFREGWSSGFWEKLAGVGSGKI
jgi:hypothetical protein